MTLKVTVDLENDRFNWKIPKCITNEDVYCTSSSVLTEDNQSIMFNKDTYKNMEVCSIISLVAVYQKSSESHLSNQSSRRLSSQAQV